jgi:hypothetical protein
LRPSIANYIVGLGGKPVAASDLEGATLEFLGMQGRANGPQWLGISV